MVEWKGAQYKLKYREAAMLKTKTTKANYVNLIFFVAINNSETYIALEDGWLFQLLPP